jgi:hypothetical protein
MKILCIAYFLFLIMSIVPAALWGGCEPVAEPTTPPGNGEDIIPPGEVTDFTAAPGDGIVQLSWINPDDSDFAGVKIMYKTTGYPSDESDGALVFVGLNESCIHDGLTNGIEYFYTAFTFDYAHTPNYSSGQSTSAIPRSPKFNQEMAKLLAPDDTVEDYFGFSVSISGDYAIVGAYGDDDTDTKAGAAYIYHWNGSVWVEQQKLKASDGDTHDYFGYSVSISGDYAVVGAIYDNNDNGTDAGSAYVFQRVGTEWLEQAPLKADDGAPYDRFGCSVFIDGEYAIIGARGDDDKGSESGSAYIFYREGTSWGQKYKFLAEDGAESNNYGTSVSISGDYVIIGANQNDNINGTDAGAAYIYYRNGDVWNETKLIADDGDEYDNFGWSVSISGDYAIVGANTDRDSGQSSGSAYIYYYNTDTADWEKQSKLSGNPYDYFGWSVFIRGDYAVVGAPGDQDNEGYAYIYQRNVAVWEPHRQIEESGVAGDAQFGYSVSMSGGYVIIGAPYDEGIDIESGSSYIYQGAAWEEKQRFLPGDEVVEDYFGFSVSINGNNAIVGAYGDDDNGDNSGSACIFHWSGVIWEHTQKIKASDGAARDSFGGSVSINGDYAIVGAKGDDNINGTDAGAVYIFHWNGSSWEQQQKLIASDGSADDRFGCSVSINGDYAIVGAYDDEEKGEKSGSAYIFHWDGLSWGDEKKLTASDGAEYDYFGCSVSINGDYAVVGADGDDNDNGTDAGSAYIFQKVGTEWVEQETLKSDDGAADDNFGDSLSISGDYVIIGAYGDDDKGENSGSAYIFHWNSTEWEQQQKLTASDGAANDYFGNSVSIRGDYAIVGALYDDDSGPSSGTAYIFYRNGTTWIEQKQKLTASDGENYDLFGRSVSMGEDYAIVGADYNDDKGDESGAAYIFK